MRHERAQRVIGRGCAMREHRGLLIVVSGFSGAGKGTIMKRLLMSFPQEYALSISATTRMPREGEKNGREYFFVSHQRFQSMIDGGELIEHARYVDNFYGTPRAYVEEQMAQGHHVILEIEMQGALQVKERFPEALLLFVTPPSMDELKRRLEGRGTEEPAVIEARMEQAKQEAQAMERYDYLVVNDQLEACVARVHHIIQCEVCRTFRCRQQIEDWHRELGCSVKGE